MRSLPPVLAGMLLLGAAAGAEEPSSGRGQASWWIRNHGVVTEADDPRVARAREVFGRVAAAADKRGNRLPRLVIVRGDGDPFAAAIEDGSVVLTSAGLRRCYREVDPPTGDARLAFLLGHELSHLAKDDFWHFAAFATVEAHLDEPRTRRSLLRLLRSAAVEAGGEGAAAARLKELEADSFGLVYMMMAGYDPAAVLAPEGGFLEAWTSQVTARAAYGLETHPSVAQRAGFLEAQLRTVRHELDFFHFGVRLLQLGREDDAILLLARFSERFPSREVFSNLGLAHYRLAARALHRCDPELAVRFRLSTELDPATLAGGRRAPARSGSGAGCRQRPAFQEHWAPAVASLEHAVRSDPTYLPAKVNLSSAYILAGDHGKALGVLDDLDGEAAGSPGALNNRAVALYLFGLASGIDAMDQAARILDRVAQRHPGHVDAIYNLGLMESERGRHAAARQHWTTLLEREPDGPWADRVRERLGIPAEPGSRPDPARVEPRPPLRLGPLDEEIEGRLASMSRRPFRLGVFRGEFAARPPTRALVLEEFVEIVETALPARLERAEAVRRHGPPGRALALPDGELLIWDRFALEMREGGADRIIHFESGGR